LIAAPVVFGWVRLAGAVYLGWIGLNLIVRPHQPGELSVAPAAQAFRRGLVTNLLNPKVGVFYLTLLPQFLPPGSADPVAGLVLAGVHVAIGLVWGAVIIGCARAIAPLLQSARFARAIDRVCGMVFVGFGLKLAISRA